MTPVSEESSSRPILASRIQPLHRRSRGGRRLKRTLIWTGAGLLAAVITGGSAVGFLIHEASSVRAQLEQTMQLVPKLGSELEGGDYERARDTFRLMQAQTAGARETVTSPVWRAASVVPFVGSNFQAVREVAVSADDVALHAVGPLLEKYDSFDWDTLSPKDGRIDIGQLRDAAPTISAAETTVRLSHQRLVSIDLSGLVPQVAEPIRTATGQLKKVSDTLGAASTAAQLVPSMLGSEGPRNYLVLVQNSAETRATGGIPGALAILHADDGLITLGDQSSASALGVFNPSLDVDKEQEAIFTARLGTQMQNVNLTPDFPSAASTAKMMWEAQHKGQEINGVLALDPVVLRHLLNATGPVDVTDPEILQLIEGTSLPSALTQDNVLPTLLSAVYREIEDPRAQDAYFMAVAERVFAAFTDGQADSGQLIKALTTSVQEQRVYLWSNHPGEQERITSTALAGTVVSPDAGGAIFGAYFNDGTGAKMDFYVARTVQLLQTCGADNYNGYTVRTTVTNNAPLDAASTLPSYVTGGGVFGVEPGRVRTNYVVYGPAQSSVETATVNGQSVPIGAGRHGHRPVGTVTLELGPGESAVLDVSFSRIVQDSDPRLMVTPSIASLEEVILPTIRENSCEGSQ